MKKKIQICFPKCLKSAAKLRRANQTARAILTAPTVHNTVDTDNIGDTVLRVKLGLGAKCIFTLCPGTFSPVMFNP
jgi:hypothetical protein